MNRPTDPWKSYALRYGLPAVLVAAVVYAIASVPPPPHPHEALLQGTWKWVQAAEGQYQYREWTFREGAFQLTGNPLVQQSGKYRITSSDGQLLQLLLHAQKGDLGPADRTITVRVRQDAHAELTIDGDGPFALLGR